MPDDRIDPRRQQIDNRRRAGTAMRDVTSGQLVPGEPGLKQNVNNATLQPMSADNRMSDEKWRSIFPKPAAPAQPSPQAGGSTMPSSPQAASKVQTATLGAVSQPPQTPPTATPMATPQQADAARLDAAVATNPMAPGVGVAQVGPPSFKPPAPLPLPVGPQSTDWRKPGFVPATVQSQMTSTGRSASNAAAGMVVDPKYRPTNGEAVAYVTTGPAPTARTGRIIDETGDRTAEFMQNNFVPAGVKRQQEEVRRRELAAKIPESMRGSPFNPLRKVEERYAPPRPMAYDPEKKPSPDFGSAKAASAAPVTQPAKTSTPTPSSQPQNATNEGPLLSDDHWVNKSGIQIMGEALGNWATNRHRDPSHQGGMRNGLDILQDAITGEPQPESKPALGPDHWINKPGHRAANAVGLAKSPPATPAPSYKPPMLAPQPELNALEKAQAMYPNNPFFNPQSFNPVDRVLAKYAPVPKKKATPVSRNGSMAQVRFAAGAY